MKKQNRARVFNLTHSLKPLARSIGRRNRKAIARQAMKDAKIKKKVVELMGKVLSKELTHLSSRKVNSSLRDSSAESIEELNWNGLVQELGTEAPVMLSLLRECVHVKRRAYRPKGKGGTSARRGCSHQHVLCGAITCKMSTDEPCTTNHFDATLWEPCTQTGLSAIHYTKVFLEY